MKSKIASFSFALLFFALSTPLRAQYSSSWWGVRLGANFASEGLDSLPASTTTGMKTGVIGGLAYDHWFNDTWGVDISALYDQKGVSEQYSPSAAIRSSALIGRNDTPAIVYSGNDNYTLNYIEVPVVVKFSFGMGDIRPYIDAGPSFGFLLGASESADGSVVPVSDLKSYLNSVDVSVYVGLGIADELYHGPMITFDAGYAAGLTKIYKSTASPDALTRLATNGKTFPIPIDPTSAKSGDIRVLLGVMWPIGGTY